jgi:hypothetical protein
MITNKGGISVLTPDFDKIYTLTNFDVLNTNMLIIFAESIKHKMCTH